MNFIWRPFSKHFGNQKQIFTSTMQDHYCWIPGFWYDEKFLGDEPVVIDEEFDTYNAPQKSQVIIDYITNMANNYKGNHMMMPFGCDFTFGNAKMTFENMDRLI
jgi:lysosomal alpha-mannosidase